MTWEPVTSSSLRACGPAARGDIADARGILGVLVIPVPDAVRLAAALALALAVTAPLPARPDAPENPWARGEPRPFLAAVVDLGTSAHAALAAGWGKPHDAWGGALARGYLTSDFAAGRLGGRVDLLAVALEAGLRVNRTFAHLALPREDRHRRIPAGHGAVTRVLDLSAAGGLPAGPGFAIYEILAVRMLSTLGDVHVYDELLRVVYRPPWLATASAGWLASLRDGALLAGARAQWAFETGRGGAPFVRAGPVAYWRLRPHLALAGELLYPVSQPDRLGLLDPIQAFAVLEYTAATGDRLPRFP